MWERQMDGRRRIGTAIMTHNLFSWPYHAVLSSKPYVFSSDETCSTGPRQGSTGFTGASVLYLPSRLTASTDRLGLQLKLSREHLCIWFRNTQIFPINHVTAPLVIFIGASWEENLCLGARSKVNMQQKELYLL